MAEVASTNEIILKSSQSTNVAKNLFLNEKYADVHFSLVTHKGKLEVIPAHKNILGIASNVFEVMFDERWKESHTVKINDVTAETFKKFLQFFYLDEVKMNEDNICDVTYLVKKYQLNDCLILCENFLIQVATLNEICASLDIAILFDLCRLKKYSLQKINEHTITVLRSTSFLECSKDAVKCILESGEVHCRETVVFDACMNWATYKCKVRNRNSSVINLKNELGNCLHLIQFHLMPPHQRSEYLIKFKDLFDKDELEEIRSLETSNSSLKIFKSIDRINLKWSDASILECLRREIVTKGERKMTTSRKTSRRTLFQVNRRMLLGALKTSRLFTICWNGGLAVKGELIICEVRFNDIEMLSKIILKQSFVHNHFEESNYTKFHKAILIKSDLQYEIIIQFSAKTLRTEYYFYNKERESEASFGEDEEYKVNFVESYEDYGFISSLYFNAT